MPIEDDFLTFEDTSHYENFHHTQKIPIRGVWTICNSVEGRPSQSRLRETAMRMQSLISQAVLEKVRLRAIGRKWSFSDVPAVKDGWILETDRLNYSFNVSASNLSRNFVGNGRELLLVQTGCLISEINRDLETKTRRQALRTSGASNGQTIGGAINTCTHGSALGVGGLPSQVAGFQLLTATNNYWIERPSAPTMNEDFARKLNATLIRDEQLFQTALVGLGAVGIVHTYMLRTTGRYRLHSERRCMRMFEIRRALNTLDFHGVPLPETDRYPYFFQAVINPGMGRDDVYVTTRYKGRCPKNLVPDYSLTSKHSLHNDLPSVIAKLSQLTGRLGPKLVTALLKQQQADEKSVGTPGETYALTSGRNGVLGAAFCVPIGLTTDAVDIVREVIAEKFGPLIIALRYVQKTDGYLAFTRFDPGCVLDIDGLDTSAARDVLNRVLTAFDREGIPYTQHWGKINGLTKARLEAGYGDNIDRWKLGRERLLPNADEQYVFSSDMTDRLGLT